MTNKEAIEILKKHISPYDKCKADDEANQAIRLAIKALEERPQGDLIKAFELLKAHCKNRECNKDCVFYRELRVGDNTEQFCGLCEIVISDDKENNNDNISKEEIRDKMFFVREEDSNQPIAVIKVSDLLENDKNK